MQLLPSVEIPKHFNYIGIFLTLGCNLSCSYCINYLSGLEKKRKLLSSDDWAAIINRLEIPNDLPITIQGGEPSIHPYFFEILRKIKADIKIDLLTNLQFDVDKFTGTLSPERFLRKSPYASIRVSYHPETMALKPLVEKAKKLSDKGFPIAIYSVEIDKYRKEIEEATKLLGKENITFKLKTLLGSFEDKLHGEMKYKGAVAATALKTCDCRTSELLLSPEGEVYRCHHDLYNKKFPTGNLSSPDFELLDDYKPCHFFGNCNPCDIKVKNNRFQQHGHTSVTIKNIREREME